MFKFNKKLITVFALAIAAVATLAGCGKQEEEPEVVYELTAVDSSQLQPGKIYVKDGESFYECPLGTPTFDKVKTDTTADSSRVIMFGKDDVLIPTLYKDQQLVYVTTDTPKSFIWERYEDEGYTVGVCGLNATTTNKYSLTVDVKYLLQGSTLRTLMGENGLKTGNEVIFNKINSTPITAENISIGGSILGLTEGEAYSLDVYKGSEYTSLTNVIADTHVFANFEVFETQDFEYAEADYIIMNIPENLMSGYYYISGLGFVRYVDGSAVDGCAKVDFNVPYYYEDTNGNIYTYEEIKAEGGTDEGETEVVDSSKSYNNTIYVDCSNKEMTISITYEDATTLINGKETAISDSEVGFPSATLTGPDGSSYIFAASNQSEKTLTCTVETPISGEWTTTISNISQRRFAVYTEFDSGHSDTLLHTGSGRQEMTYYLKDNMVNGLFAITWENKSRAATIEIEAPDGTEYSKEIDPNLVYSEGYGYIEFVLGELNYGDYTISISGDELGRVRCQAEDIAVTGAPTIVIE